MRLEADNIIQGRTAVILPELYDGIRQDIRAGNFQTDRFHRAVPERIDTAARHDFHRHAAFKNGRFPLKFMKGRTFRRCQRTPEGFIFFPRKRAV